MARVPTYAKTIDAGGVTGARLRPVSSGDGVGEGLRTVGRSLGQIVEMDARVQEVRAEEEARRLDVEHMQTIRPVRLRARQARGIAAREAATTAEQEMRDAGSALLERASSPLARRMLEATIARRNEQELESLSNYALGQETQAIDQGHEARASSLVEEALDHGDDPLIATERMSAALEEVRQRGRFNGWDAATLGQQELGVRSRFYSGRARQLFEAGDPEAAMRLVDENRENMTADDEAAARRLLRPEVEANETERLGAEILTGIGAASPATGNVNATGGAGEVATGLRAGRVAGRRVSEPVIAGILGNLEHENRFNPQGARGDGGTAHGMAQWRHERVENFRRVIGVDIRQSTRAQQTQFILHELNNPREAGMTVAQRDQILAAQTPEEAARLFDRFYERSNGRSREQRATAARRYHEGGVTPDGTRIDLAQAYQAIDGRADWTESQRRRVREWVRGQAGLNDQIVARREQDAERQIATVVDDMARNGRTLTRLSQLPAAALANASPGTITTLQNSIRANTRREEARPNSEAATNLAVMAATDPNAFLRQNIGLYRGQITDAEVQDLTLQQARIRSRSGPQPNEILSMINLVLPETSILPAVDQSARQNVQQQQTAARNAALLQARGSLLAAVSRRLHLTHGQAEVTQDQILAAVRAEVTQTVVNGQPMPIYQARERGATQFPVNVPSLALPSIIEMLRRAGLPDTSNNRVQMYLRNRDMIDRAVNRGRSGAGAVN